MASSLEVHSAEYSVEQMSPEETAQWVRNRFNDPKAYSIEVDLPDGVNYTHSLDLSVVVLKNAGWNNLQTVADHFQRVAEIYSKCEIKINEIQMVMVDAGTNTLNEYDTEQFAKRTPGYFKRPTLYFASKVSDEHQAYAWSGVEGCKNNAAKCNTAWISSIVNTDRYKSLRDPKYNVVAHELAHIIGDYDHNKTHKKNILGEYQNGGEVITPEQCRKFKTFSEINEL